MTPESALASHRRFLTDRVTVIRNVQGSATVLAQADDVQARVKDYTGGGKDGAMKRDLVQGAQNAIILSQDLIDKGFPVPMKTGDIVKVGGRTLKVLDVDQNTRKVATTLIAYDCMVKGS